MTSPLYTDLRKRPRGTTRGREGGLHVSSQRDETLALSISGIGLTLTGLTPTLQLGLHHRFRLFAIPPSAAADADLVIRVRPAVVKSYIDYDRHAESKIYRLETRVHEDRLHVWSYAFAGWFDVNGRDGELSLCESSVEPPERSVENFLRVAFAWKASRLGGMLLHASGLVRNGQAYIFFGPSGSGKTTVTRLSTNDLLLNDDCIHIHRGESGFQASGVPFKGWENGGADSREAFPIAGIFRLVQSRRVFMERLGAAQSVAEITASVPFVSERAEGVEGNFETLEDLVRAVPVYRLHFRLAPDFWNVIEEGLRG